MKNMICFDMDGTIAGFYNVPNWLSRLRAEDPGPYMEALPLCDMERLGEILDALRQAGYEIRVITWLSKNASPKYKKAIREAKKAWLDKWGFIADHFHGIQYGTPKTRCVRQALNGGTAILIDDDASVRNKWNLGPTINPVEEDIIEALTALL